MSSLIANAFTDSGRVIGYTGTGKTNYMHRAIGYTRKHKGRYIQPIMTVLLGERSLKMKKKGGRRHKRLF